MTNKIARTASHNNLKLVCGGGMHPFVDFFPQKYR